MKVKNRRYIQLKGNEYRIIGIIRSSETLNLILCEAFYDNPHGKV